LIEYLHRPVLLEVLLDLLAPPSEGHPIMVDANLGEGGHSEAFLRRFPHLRLIGLEVDETIAAIAEGRLAEFGDRFRLHLGWSEDFFSRYGESNQRLPEQQLPEQRLPEQRLPDRILFDLGISSFHYKKAGRGFSFLKEEPLDMRLTMSLKQTASDIVNTYAEQDLKELFREYGEERFAGRIARSIVRQRQRSPVGTSGELAGIVARAVPPAYRYGRIHPATRVFQALRIAVNSEMERLKEALAGAFRVLSPGGRLGVVAFHSLEDRIVKRFFKEKNKSCTCPDDWPICQCGGERQLMILTTKPIRPSEGEIEQNPSSRSCRLRVAQKLAGRNTEDT
jgi:16S rRNA (cytosine1402-N4)-methyltransferase